MATRREFLRLTSLAGGAIFLPSFPARARGSANDRLDLGIIGVANRGAANLGAVEGENVVALCDVDKAYLAGAAERFPRAALYVDFRNMLDAERLDAVVVSTPDHTHALAAKAALDAGLHVYCEKPLAHTVSEARILAETAARNGLVTQMGTQIHAGTNYRRVVELVQGGAIGDVSEVHVWCGKSWGGDALPAGGVPVPPRLRWDLWLGAEPYVAYDPGYHPAAWRRYWAFGNGTLGDMGCHYMDLAFWALELSHCVSAEAEGPPVDPDVAPKWLIARWRFPARGAKPACSLAWYDGWKKPDALLEELGIADWENGVLFVGERGCLVADYERHRLLPEERFAAYDRPTPWIPDSIGHHAEWIEACKSGGPTTCSFAYSGPLSETVLLGNVAFRLGRRLEWDAKRLEARGLPDAGALIRHPYPAGWAL